METKQKTVLITGATGFLGSYITRGLFEAGFHLKLLVRKTAQAQAEERFIEICPPFGIAGTELITLFCMTRKLKRLHHISTAYVAGKRRDTVLENELERGQLFNNNY